MKFIADLHIHSKYSIATAKNLDLEHLHRAARIKGITVVGTGDATHPGWFGEIREKLVPAEPGLYQLREDIKRAVDEKVPAVCRGAVRFMLSAEISNIYKKDGKTRKNHNLVYMPDLEAQSRFNDRLDKIGNIRSDGRPILGLDARDLLEIVLETDPEAFLVPAHIWTPWFSMLGSRSGFDSVNACFGDLTKHIFAVETGLSSDPAMNRRVSLLDDLTLISNSDAHSPAKLGREANIFSADLSYFAIKAALKTGDPGRFKGSFEFYPEEGKYHLDGHRKCGVRFDPEETLAHKGICPECEKPLTLGVLYRVNTLADRAHGEKIEIRHPYYSIIALTNILSDIFQVGPNSKKVKNAAEKIVAMSGPEFEVLQHLPYKILDNTGIPLLSEAIRRVREKRVKIRPGFDGEFGKIRIFEKGERAGLSGQKPLFVVPDENSKKRPETDLKKISFLPEKSPKKEKKNKKIALNKNQRRAVFHDRGPIMMIAGPGTGKTFTIIRRIIRLIRQATKNDTTHHTPEILAVTFTNKAAGEMRERVEKEIPKSQKRVYITTFHALCLDILHQEKRLNGRMVADEIEQKSLFTDAVDLVNGEKKLIKTYRYHVMRAKQKILDADEINKGDITGLSTEAKRKVASVYREYQAILHFLNRMDYEDLIFDTVRLLESREAVRRKWRSRFSHIFVDEYQDINEGQYRLVRLLAPPENNLCVIGDPDQSIYGFRGSDHRFFHRFTKDYPDVRVIRFSENYRSTDTILTASGQVLFHEKNDQHVKTRLFSGIKGVETIGILSAPTPKSEAVAIGKTIEKMVGGTGFHDVDFGKVANGDGEYGFGDFAVLYRTGAQGRLIFEVLTTAGFPCGLSEKKAFSEQAGVREMRALLCLADGSGGYRDFETVAGLFKAGIGAESLAAFKKWGYTHRFSVSAAIKQIERFPVPGITTRIQKRLYRFSKRVRMWQDRTGEKSLEEKWHFFINKDEVIRRIGKNTASIKYVEKTVNQKGGFNAFSLKTDTDFLDDKGDKISLMTMHAAKGLEFPVVFVAGCEDGLIPHRLYLENEKPVDIEEERRLFYVAMTRAGERLYLTRAKKRIVYGKALSGEISPFVKKIESDLLQASTSGLKKRKKTCRQLSLFK